MKKKLALKLENIAKQYYLGELGTGSLSDDFYRWWMKIRGKEDPFLKIGEENNHKKEGKSRYVWAIKDIAFEVEQGEILGIIGHNGAGKSTLLKILSKITAPTTGSIGINGRIASLLEIGTGFHPELTGRENIYLNGTILGMTKTEIEDKMEEIIEFSGIRRYIDTPVKRYSSGMYVRLGFAVAAHLEPEILIVDEVLAVGDAAFQEKAIGKMQEISQRGKRTILLVSHNMASIAKICTKCLVLKNGQIDFHGNTSTAIERYLSASTQSNQKIIDLVKQQQNIIKLETISVNKNSLTEQMIYGDEGKVTIELAVLVQQKSAISIEAYLIDATGKKIGFYCPGSMESDQYLFTVQEGKYHLSAEIMLPLLNKGTYFLSIYLVHPNIQGYIDIPNAVRFTCLGTANKYGKVFMSQNRGAFLLGGSINLETTSEKNLFLENSH